MRPLAPGLRRGESGEFVFDQLTEGLSGAISRLVSRGKLTDANIDEGLREVRKALLEADVALPVIKDFIEKATIDRRRFLLSAAAGVGGAMAGSLAWVILTENARHTVHDRFDGERLAQDLAALFAEATR